MYTIYDMGIRIRKRREALGKSRREMSDAMRGLGSKVNQKTIESWELGRNDCSLVNIPYICEVLDCDAEYLFGSSPTPHKETANAMEVTGLTEEAINVFREHLAKKDLPDGTTDIFSDFISLFITSEQAKKIYELFEYCTVLTFAREFIEDTGEDDAMDAIDSAMTYFITDDNEKPNSSIKYDLYVSASKHKAMDEFGELFERPFHGSEVCIKVVDGIGNVMETIGD